MRVAYVLAALVCTALLCVGCPSSEPPTPSPKAAEKATSKPAPKALPAPTPVSDVSTVAQKGADVHTAPPGPEILSTHQFETQNYRLIVEATFSGLPAGAHILAPAARDRRYQKVMKSEHSGVVGAVVPSADGDNLFFVSEPTKAGAASYVGTFEVSRRVGTEGGIDRAKGKAFADGKGTVKAGPGDAALAKDAATIGDDKMRPFDAVVAVANQSSAAAGGGEAYTTTARAASLLRLKGVPATVIGGYLAPSGKEPAKKTHSWLAVELPSVGVTPIDPVLRAGQGPWKASDKPLNMGLITAERVEMVSGDTLSIEAQEGTSPAFQLTGDLVAPRAIKDGKSVGTVTWSARFETLPAPAKK